MKANSVPHLEEGIANLNLIVVERDEKNDSFYLNESFWSCDTSQGFIYEMYNDIVNSETQRLIPVLFRQFRTWKNTYQSHEEFDEEFPTDSNAFTGINFSHTEIITSRQVTDIESYNLFVINALKYGLIKTPEEMEGNLKLIYPQYIFETRALKELMDWMEEDVALYGKIYELLDDIPANPFTGGIGETEVLKHVKGVCSKRINLANRITYKLSGRTITILACTGHYD